MILVYDTETTGLTLHPKAPINAQPRMIEFGGCLLDPETGVVEEEISMLCNPEQPLDPVITKITGLTDADLKDAATFKELLPQMRRIFGSARIVVAHNLPFDRTIIKGELARAGVTDFPWPPGEMCTVQAYREEWGFNPKLTELYERVMGKPLDQTHRALDDVLALVEVIKAERVWELL